MPAINTLYLYAGKLWFGDKPIATVDHLDIATLMRLGDRLREIENSDETDDDDDAVNINLSNIERFTVVIDKGHDRVTGTYFEGPCLPDDHRVATLVEISAVKDAIKAESIEFTDEHESD